MCFPMTDALALAATTVNPMCSYSDFQVQIRKRVPMVRVVVAPMTNGSLPLYVCHDCSENCQTHLLSRLGLALRPSAMTFSRTNAFFSVG